MLRTMVNRSSKKTNPRKTSIKNPAAVKLGRLGGLKGGKARAARLTPEERQQIARAGARQRWSKVKEGKSIRTSRPLLSADDAFEIQKKAFQEIPARVLAQYEHQFVISRDGQIIDSDFDLPTLTRRFFKRRRRSSVYITRVGGTAAVIGSPSLEE
jgi:hypothetical protein